MPETPSTRPPAQPKSFFLGPDLHDYILNHGGGPDEVQQALIAATQALGSLSRAIPPSAWPAAWALRGGCSAWT